MITMPNAQAASDAQADSFFEVDPATGRLWLDRMGMGASVACAIHCMVAPLLMLALPAAGSVWAHPLAHWAMAMLVLPLALWVIYCGYCKHGKRLALVAAGLGSLLIMAGLILPMMGIGWGVSASLPEWLVGGFAGTPGGGGGVAGIGGGGGGGGGGVGGGAAVCTDTCCPSVVQNAQTGGRLLIIPAGSLTTMIGSLLLFLAHATNLLACRCFSPRTDSAERSDSDCGCASGAC